MMRRLLPLFLCIPMMGQTTITIPGTVKASGVVRPGMNLGGEFAFAQMQMLRTLNFSQYGYLQKPIWRQSYECSPGAPIASVVIASGGSGQTPGTYPLTASGGSGAGGRLTVVVDITGVVSAAPTLTGVGNGYTSTPTFTLAAGGSPATFTVTLGSSLNSTTAVYGGELTSSSNPYPANFWAGGTYTVVSQTGSTPQTGTITASTDNTTTGPLFTLGTPLAAPCTSGTNTANSDIIIVRQENAPVGTTSASGFGAGATYVADTSPASANTYQSVDIPSGVNKTFYIDAVFTTWAPDPTIHGVTWLNINGTYDLTYKAKCTGGAGSVAWSIGRIGTGFGSGTDTLAACTSTAGAGWTTFHHSITVAETGSQNQNIAFSLTGTSAGGSVRYQDMDFIEPAVLSGNTTIFRDDVVSALQKINPGSLRLMTPNSWSSSIPCMITTSPATRCVSGINGTNINSLASSIGYDDFLQLCYLLKTEPYINVGHFNTPADWVTLMNWLQSSGWNALFTAQGLHIHIADGNEPWNPGAAGEQDAGNGKGYGSTMGQKMAAARGAAGYTSNIKLVGGNWFSGSQAHFNGGGTWVNGVMVGAGCTLGSNNCPDEMEIAPYTLDVLDNIVDPFTDEVAEGSNFNSVFCNPATCSANSTGAAQSMLSSVYGINTTIYEMSYSTVGGSATPTQAQFNGITSGVGMALNTYRNALLMERDAGIYGPRNEFAFVDQAYNGGCCTLQQTSWSAMQYMATGPGQTAGSFQVPRPVAIAYGIGNTAIGSNSKLMDLTQSGTPTLNYAAGQNGNILTNAAVNLVDCFTRGDGSTHYTLICFNMSGSNQTVNFSGAGKPAGTVTRTSFGGPTYAMTDNNISSVSNNNPTVVVTTPTPTTLSSPTSDTLSAQSMTVYTYTTGALVPNVFISGGVKMTGGVKFQ